MRTWRPSRSYSRVPVINGLSDDLHPCNFWRHAGPIWSNRGTIQGKTVAWIGVAITCATPLIPGGHAIRFPTAHRLARRITSRTPISWPWAGDRVSVDARSAGSGYSGAHLINTDVCGVHGSGKMQAEARMKRFAPYQVHASHGWIWLTSPAVHALTCRPTGEEVSSELMD